MNYPICIKMLFFYYYLNLSIGLFFIFAIKSQPLKYCLLIFNIITYNLFKLECPRIIMLDIRFVRIEGAPLKLIAWPNARSSLTLYYRSFRHSQVTWLRSQWLRKVAKGEISFVSARIHIKYRNLSIWFTLSHWEPGFIRICGGTLRILLNWRRQ